MLTATPEMWNDPLPPEEEACVAQAAPKRRREFAAGRNCARAALARLGIEGVALPRDGDRLPAWPPGVVGSITHRADFCAVAVARKGAVCGLGLDAELAQPLGDRLIRRFCRPDEIARHRGLDAADSTPWSSLVFSAKESAYKCYYGIARQTLGLRDLDVTLQPEAGSFSVAVLRSGAPPAHGLLRFHGRFARRGELFLTAVAVTEADRRRGIGAHRSSTRLTRPASSASTGQ